MRDELGDDHYFLYKRVLVVIVCVLLPHILFILIVSMAGVERVQIFE